MLFVSCKASPFGQGSLMHQDSSTTIQCHNKTCSIDLTTALLVSPHSTPPHPIPVCGCLHTKWLFMVITVSWGHCSEHLKIEESTKKLAGTWSMATKLALIAVVALLTVACSSAQKLTPIPSPPPLCPSQPKVTCECNCSCDNDKVSLLQYHYLHIFHPPSMMSQG